MLKLDMSRFQLQFNRKLSILLSRDYRDVLNSYDKCRHCITNMGEVSANILRITNILMVQGRFIRASSFCTPSSETRVYSRTPYWSQQYSRNLRTLAILSIITICIFSISLFLVSLNLHNFDESYRYFIVH